MVGSPRGILLEPAEQVFVDASSRHPFRSAAKVHDVVTVDARHDTYAADARHDMYAAKAAVARAVAFPAQGSTG